MPGRRQVRPSPFSLREPSARRTTASGSRGCSKRGARIVFVAEASFAGTLEAQGFEEALMRLKPKRVVEEEPGQFWKDFIRETAPQFRKPTIEQVGFPAVLASGIAWVRIVSCNPLELKDRELPPVFSGLPSGDRIDWDEFRRRYRELHEDLQRDFSAFCVERGAPPLPDGEFIHESAFLDLYLYPAEVDYQRSRPLGPTWHRLDSCVREAPPWEPPPGDGRLVYLSLGSLGSGDVELMQRLIHFLAETPHRVVVSMGPQHEQLELAQNMSGAEFLPQPSVLRHADLVITHGGNNTVTESLHFGKPMIVLPLFWDQYDNAQRMDELGLGVRLAPYELEGPELHAAIERMLGDKALHERLGTIAARLQASPGTARAADLIGQLAGFPGG